MKILRIGQEVKLKGTGFEVKINGFKTINDNKMICTDYGDFNIDLIDEESL